MSRLVILNLGQGNLRDGFPSVNAQIKWLDDPNKESNIPGSLPPNADLLECYRRWQLLYELVYQARSIRIRSSNTLALEDGIAIDETDITQVSDADFKEICQELQTQIDRWFDSPEFKNIYNRLQQQLERDRPIRFIIQTEDRNLRQLPWHIWRFFSDYPLAEVSLSPLNFESTSSTKNNVNLVRILAILGDSTGIDVQADRQLLENLCDADSVFLVECDRKTAFDALCDKQGWDILFFAGHSSTHEDGETGEIYINPQESVSIDELKNALRKAIERGLQLAIFNSCNGLGLARQLSDLQIPQTIVMREPVPDKVAQAFLKYFLEDFSEGNSFDLAARHAREMLQGMEKDFPGASWLPVIFQNPAQKPPTWAQLQGQPIKPVQPSIQPIVPPTVVPIAPPTHTSLSLPTLLLASVACTVAILGARASGWLQGWELKSFDSLMQLRSTFTASSEGRDERLLIVDISLADIDALGNEYPLQDKTLLRALQQIDRHNPKAIGLDLIRDRPVGEGNQQLAQYFQQHPHITPVCVHPGGGDAGNNSPNGSNSQQTGFIDIDEDPDGIVRRHLLAVVPPNNSLCSAQYALSVQLAKTYLQSKGYKLTFPGNNSWQFSPTDDTTSELSYSRQTNANNDTWQISYSRKSSLRFQLLGGFEGFYQNPKQTQGNQILLSYRTYDASLNEIAPRVTLSEVLQGKVDANLIRDRIVLIGVTDRTVAEDEVATPYQHKIRGLMLHAQMTSQLLSAVEDRRPLLRFMPFWVDAIWIWGCTLLILVLWQGFPSLISLGMTGIAIVIIYGIGFIILIQTGAIVPFVPSIVAAIAPSIGMVIYIVWQSERKSFIC
jgi:CHASE2 domain-containing sensor protein